LDDALKALAVFDERKSQVVELRFFGGLTIEETAEVLKVSPDTIMRDWNVARLWLHRELSQTKNQLAIRNLFPFEDGETKNIKE
jgi:DNA-directed RNA polymerase specialized sigma24 family protein